MKLRRAENPNDLFKMSQKRNKSICSLFHRLYAKVCMEYFYFSLDGMLVHRWVTPRIKFAGTHLYTWVERGTVEVSLPRTQQNVPRQRYNPGLLDPESSAQTMRPPRLPLK